MSTKTSGRSFCSSPIYLTQVTGDAIAAQICKDLEDLGMQLSGIHGQGYDEAANMASERVGVRHVLGRNHH